MPRAKKIAVKPRPTRQLRQRKTTNYLEKTLENSTQLDVETPKSVKAPIPKQSLRNNPSNQSGSTLKNLPVRVPVYRQLLDISTKKPSPNPSRKSKVKDLYQFDESDLEPAVKKKQKRLKTNKPRTNKPKTAVVPQNLRAKKLDKYDNKIQDILKNVMTKVKERKEVPENRAITNTKVPVLATTKNAEVISKKPCKQAENRTQNMKTVPSMIVSDKTSHAPSQNSCRQLQPFLSAPLKTAEIPSQKLAGQTATSERNSKTVAPVIVPEIASYSPIISAQSGDSCNQSQELAEKLNGTSAKNVITVTADVHNESSFDPYRSMKLSEEQAHNCVDMLDKPAVVVIDNNQTQLQSPELDHNRVILVNQPNTVSEVPSENQISSRSGGLENRVSWVKRTITVPMIVPGKNPSSSRSLEVGNCINMVKRTITVPMVRNMVNLSQEQNQQKSTVHSKSGNFSQKNTVATSPDVNQEGNSGRNDCDLESIQNDDSSDSLDESCFGFSSTDSSPQKSPNKVNIISQVILSPDSEFVCNPEQFKRTRPQANSTMLFKKKNQDRENSRTPPWRFNAVTLRRNPHFITLKEDALPCLHQDAVLDHTLVDKLRNVSLLQKKVSGNSPERPKKSPVQKTLADCFNRSSCKENNPEPSLQKSSLFDVEEFSPIKPQTRWVHNKPEIEAVKRNVLGALDTNIILNNSNVQSASTPKKSKEAPASLTRGQENRTSYFGFDSSSDEAEPSPRKNSITKLKTHKPFRLSMNENDRKYVPRKSKFNKKNFEVAPVPISEPEESCSDDDEHEAMSSDVDMVPQVPEDGRETPAAQARLFEDLEKPQDIDEMDVKLPKRKKYKWMTSGNPNKKPRKKTKDIRTKHEEDEAEKWYSKFNRECDEVENFPLEIE